MAIHSRDNGNAIGRYLTFGSAVFLVMVLVLHGVAILDLLARAARKQASRSATATDVLPLPSGASGGHSRFAVRELTFMGGHPVASDAGKRYPIPSWRDVSGDGTANQDGENHFPVCYTGGSFVRIAATFSARGIEEGRSVRIVGLTTYAGRFVGSSRVDLQACKLEYSIVSPK